MKKKFFETYGPWALVTGASDGIGKQIACQLAKKNINLILVARRQKLLDELADELSQQQGVDQQIEIQTLSADLSRPDDIHGLIEFVRDYDLGLLVNAAGFGTSGPFDKADLGQELNMLDVNCRASLMLSHHVGKQLAQKKRGGIILFGSLVGFQGVAKAAHYAATKAYIQVLGEGLHMEMKKHNVDVLISAPGPVRSGFADRAAMTLSMASSAEVAAAGSLKALGKAMTVRPGLLSKFLEFALWTTFSRYLRTLIMSQIMHSMTRKQSH